MSGSAGGLLIIPLVLGVAPILGAVLVGGAIYAAANVASSVSNGYEAHQRAKRERIRQSAENERIGSFRDKVLEDMREETRLNAEVSSKMSIELENARNEARAMLEEGDSEKYRHYLGELQGSRAKLGEKLASMQDGFTKEYHARIADSMEAVGKEITRQHEAYLEELMDQGEPSREKRERAKGLASSYLEEARSLIDSLKEDFQGDAFSGPRLDSLISLVGEASRQFGAGQYEACIAVSKDASVSAIEEIYKADCKKQEWENWRKVALTLAKEMESYLTAQEVITAETKRAVEEKTGKELQDEIVGVRIGDYTDRSGDGQTRFDFLLGEARARASEIEAATPASMPSRRLREIASELNGHLYPEAMTAIYKGILNMNNAFARQNLSEEIVDFFEEHNFTFNGYGYDEDRHDGALHIGLGNEATGEEIVVTLAPEAMSSGDVQTRVSIDQLKGDERNEERKAYYRECVQEVVAKATPGASISLKCEQSTKNRLSPNAQLRDKLKQQ
ncbi:MAG: hypothetical protein LBQ19_00290 [Synergistaceae bacterium]|jgi:hypothetical protein|nr:hypothetical protein [Synergistaceae bacterium]